jgi:IS30 family transposase
MGQRGYKQLTERDRVLISKLRRKKLTITEIALRIGKDKSTVSRELRRNAVVITPQDRFFLHRIQNLWSEEQLDEYLKSRPPEDRRTEKVWIHAEAHTQCGLRAWRASQKRRRKKPETRKWVVAKLRGGWSPQQIAGRSKIDGPESVWRPPSPCRPLVSRPQIAIGSQRCARSAFSAGLRWLRRPSERTTTGRTA